MTTEAEPDAEVEIVGGYNCEEQDPSVEVHVEKEGVLEKDSPENGDQAKICPSMKDNEEIARDTNGATKKPTKDAEGQTKTSKDQVEKEAGENTMKDPPDVDTSFRVEGQVPCASNIQDQEDKNTEFFVLNTGGDASCAVGAGGADDNMEIINEKYEPPQENGDALVNASVDAICAGGAGEDTTEPPQENGDASMDASCKGGAIVGAGGAVGASAAKYVRHNDGTMPHPWEDGGDARGVASYVRNDDGTVSRPWEDGGDARGVVNYVRNDDGMVSRPGEDPRSIQFEKYVRHDDGTVPHPWEDAGDARGVTGYVRNDDGTVFCPWEDGGDARGVAGYVRNNDGTVSRPWEDGGDARGVAGYVRNDDGMVSCPWEDPRNIQFESKPAIILDINGVLLTSVDKRYCS
ncbi:hypothetical protein L7F22_006924 [Adiantum nelumboides]|nr:hypothetical protein [Adiantum nelumboides]